MDGSGVREHPGGPVAMAAGETGGGEAAREALRVAHGVHPIGPEHEGLGLDRQPNSVFGFVSAPAIAKAPLYARPIYQSYEAHKLADGTTVMLGYVTPDVARALRASTEVIHARVCFAPLGEATVLVSLPYNRIRRHKEHSQRSGGGLQLDLEPVTPAAS